MSYHQISCSLHHESNSLKPALTNDRSTKCYKHYQNHQQTLLSLINLNNISSHEHTIRTTVARKWSPEAHTVLLIQFLYFSTVNLNKLISVTKTSSKEFHIIASNSIKFWFWHKGDLSTSYNSHINSLFLTIFGFLRITESVKLVLNPSCTNTSSTLAKFNFKLSTFLFDKTLNFQKTVFVSFLSQKLWFESKPLKDKYIKF